MANIALHHLGAGLLSPVLSYFNQHLLANKPAQRPLFFLAREGYWLEKSYQGYASACQQSVDSRYLLVSRAFLFKIGLLTPETHAYSLNFHFTGSINELLRTRFMISDSKIRATFDKTTREQVVQLPADLNKVSALLSEKQTALADMVQKSRDAYHAYLTKLGFFDHDQVDLVDLGYSGTIQTLLTILYGVDTKGHYLIASKPGERELTNAQGTQSQTVMTGYLKEGVKLTQGYVPLDRSMFLEGLLTAPVGQFQDIRLSQLPHRDFDYYYGRKVATQREFHLVKAVFEGAMAQMQAFAAQGITFTQQEVEDLYTSYVKKKGMLPKDSWPLFEIDDDIASEGTVNGIDFFGLRL